MSFATYARFDSQDKLSSKGTCCRQDHTLCLSLRSMNGRRTWWRRLMMRRFSSSVSKACHRIIEHIKTSKLTYIKLSKKDNILEVHLTTKVWSITCSSADGSATFSKGLLNHWAKSSEELKILGNRKFNKAHSSSKLFWNDKHNRITLTSECNIQSHNLAHFTKVSSRQNNHKRGLNDEWIKKRFSRGNSRNQVRTIEHA
jgi:hypothetical protein